MCGEGRREVDKGSGVKNSKEGNLEWRTNAIAKFFLF
jgi:hypothetical protein